MKPNREIPPEVRSWLAQIGRRGGSKTGRCKRRGPNEYYRKLALLRHAKAKLREAEA